LEVKQELNINTVERDVSDVIDSQDSFFLVQAEKLVQDYQADTQVGDPADPAVFVRWIATIIKSGYHAGADIAFQAIRTDSTGMTQKDYLKAWGYLQTLKDIFEEKAKEAAEPEDKDRGAGVTGSYTQTCAQISAMQRKINEEAERMGAV